MDVSDKACLADSRNDTNFLRAAAICLIINSHMDEFYPVRFLATGGMIGNSIFFMLSSLGLYLSWQTKQQKDFGAWYGGRISRIYPAVWATILLVLIPRDMYLGTLSTDHFLAEAGKFFYPPYWFLQALLIYYLVIYFLLKSFSQKRLLCAAVPFIVFYAVYYTLFLDLTKFSIESHFFRIIFYFLVFLWGLYLGTVKDKISFSGWRDLIGLATCVGIIYAHKLLMARGMLPQIQFVQHIAVFPLLYYALKAAKSDFITKTVMNSPFWGKPINFISLITLELFIVGNSIDGVMAQAITGFPLNAISFVTATFILATVVYYLAPHIRKMFGEVCR